MNIKKAFITFLFLLSFVFISAFISAVSVVAERSQTLAQVRDIDFQIIASLLDASNPGKLESIHSESIQNAFDWLRGNDPGKPRIGLILEKDGVIAVSNIDAVSVSDLQKQYGLDNDAIEQRELGEGWILTGILIDRKYDFTAWHSFLTVPYRQFIDGRGANWGVISHKAEIPFIFMMSAGLVLLALWAVWWRQASQQVQRLEREVYQASVRLENAEHNLEAEKSEAETLLEKIQAGKARLDESDKELDTTTSKLRNLENSRSLQKTELEKLRRDKDELTLSTEKYRLEQADLQVLWEEAENRAEQIEKELVTDREEHAALVKKLQNTEASSSKGCNRLLEGIWNINWHREALKEASAFFGCHGQPAEKRQLRELLHEISHIRKMPPDNNKWSPFKTHADIWVWHNGGKQQAKLYWTQLDGQTTVIAVDSGKDKHQRFDGGDKLKQRVDSMPARRKKAA